MSLKNVVGCHGDQDGRPPLPLWARAADALTIAALVTAGVVLVSGGFAFPLGPLVVRSHSVLRPLLIAVLLVALRHRARPAPSLHHRLRAGVASLGSDCRATLVTTALASRLAVLVAGFYAVAAIGLANASLPGRDALRELPVRYDATWYGGIALAGYEFNGSFETQQNFAFFPAYPMLIRAAGYVVGAFEEAASVETRMVRALWAGVIISVGAFTWAVLYLVRLARETVGGEHAAAAVGLLAAYPFAIFFSAAYTESVFLLGTVATFYHFRRTEWVRAAPWGALVGLTRPNGCLLSIVLACVIIEHLWRARGGDWRDYPFLRALLCAAAPACGMLAYSAYVRHLTGAWFGWAYVHAAWGRNFIGLTPVWRLVEWIQKGVLLEVTAAIPVEVLNALGLTFAVVMIWPVLRCVGFAGGVFVLVNVIPAMLSGGVLSMGRFTSTLFPVFLAVAAIVPRPLLAPTITAFAVGQGLVAALFFTWRALF